MSKARHFAVAAGLAACALGRPAAATDEVGRSYPIGREVVRERALAWLADRGFAVRNTSSRHERILAERHAAADDISFRSWATCGPNAGFTPRRTDLTLTLRGDASSARLTVRPRFSELREMFRPGEFGRLGCKSTGRLERDLLDALSGASR